MHFLLTSIFDAPDSAPSSWYEPMLMPVIFTFFGAVVFVGGRLLETQQNKDVKGKWFGVALLLLALVLGFARVWHLRNLIYAEILKDWGKKFLFSHWLAFLFPLLACIAIFGWYYWDKRRSEFR